MRIHTCMQNARIGGGTSIFPLLLPEQDQSRMSIILRYFKPPLPLYECESLLTHTHSSPPLSRFTLNFFELEIFSDDAARPKIKSHENLSNENFANEKKANYGMCALLYAHTKDSPTARHPSLQVSATSLQVEKSLNSRVVVYTDCIIIYEYSRASFYPRSRREKQLRIYVSKASPLCSTESSAAMDVIRQIEKEGVKVLKNVKEIGCVLGKVLMEQ